jgi:hypothetical protein
VTQASAFLHDGNARNDTRSTKLRMKLGFEGYGIMWALVEMMNEAPEDEYCVENDIEFLSFALQCSADPIQKTI